MQLAHNTRHPEKGYSRAEDVYSFGRRDELDVAAQRRLVNSLSRFVSPEDMPAIAAEGNGLKFISSQPAGGAVLLRGPWQRIGIDGCLAQAAKDRDFTAPSGDSIYAKVANRALASSSKRAVVPSVHGPIPKGTEIRQTESRYGQDEVGQEGGRQIPAEHQ